MKQFNHRLVKQFSTGELDYPEVVVMDVRDLYFNCYSVERLTGPKLDGYESVFTHKDVHECIKRAEQEFRHFTNRRRSLNVLQ